MIEKAVINVVCVKVRTDPQNSDEKLKRREYKCLVIEPGSHTVCCDREQAGLPNDPDRCAEVAPNDASRQSFWITIWIEMLQCGDFKWWLEDRTLRRCRETAKRRHEAGFEEQGAPEIPTIGQRSRACTCGVDSLTGFTISKAM